jgi:hypothetical protein
MALQVAYTNPDVFEDWFLFAPCCTAFAHREPNFEHFDPPLIEEVAWGLTVLKAIQPNQKPTNDLLKYIGVSAAEDGLTVFPWADDLNISTNPLFQGLYAQDDETQALAEQALVAFRHGEPPEDFEHDEFDHTQAQVAKLFAIAAAVKKGLRP